MLISLSVLFNHDKLGPTTNYGSAIINGYFGLYFSLEIMMIVAGYALLFFDMTDGDLYKKINTYLYVSSYITFIIGMFYVRLSIKS